MKITERINHLIEESKYNQSDLANKMGVKPSAISKQLSKETNSIRLVLAVHKITGATLHWLITGEGEMYSELERKWASLPPEEAKSIKKELAELKKTDAKTAAKLLAELKKTDEKTDAKLKDISGEINKKLANLREAMDEQISRNIDEKLIAQIKEKFSKGFYKPPEEDPDSHPH